MSKYSAAKEHIDLVSKLLSLYKKGLVAGENMESAVSKILSVQARINQMLFSTENFSAVCYGVDEFDLAMSQGQSFSESVEVWLEFIEDIAEMIKGKSNSLDGDFYALMSYFSVSDEESIISDMKRNLDSALKKSPEITKRTLGFYNNLSHLWGKISPKDDEYEMITDRVKSLKDHENDFLWLYERLADYRSKNVLYRTLQNWLIFDVDELSRMREITYLEYSDFDILTCDENEVFVDCGAFDGDSASNFIESFKKYKKIYCYEAEEENYEKLKENLKIYDNIVPLRKAVGDSHSVMSISTEEDGSSLLKGGDCMVDVVPLDDDITEPVTLVKMDIEGAEQAAIRGMERHIKEDRPKLIICVYHGNRDIVEIPMLIENIRDDYKLYLRNHGTPLLNAPVDTAIYAV